MESLVYKCLADTTGLMKSKSISNGRDSSSMEIEATLNQLGTVVFLKNRSSIRMVAMLMARPGNRAIMRLSCAV